MGKLFDFVGSFFDSIFGGAEEPVRQAAAPAPAPIEPPVFEPPPVMPTADDDAVKRAKKKSIAAQVARRGRASTILTQNDDAVGGALAGADNLGV